MITTIVEQAGKRIGVYHETDIVSSIPMSVTELIRKALPALHAQAPVSITITCSQPGQVTLQDDVDLVSGVSDAAVTIVAEAHVGIRYEYVSRENSEKKRERAIIAVCSGEQSSVDVVCRTQTQGKQRLSLHTVQIHHASHTKSNVDIKGVCHDSSRTEVDTLIHVIKGIAGVDAQQMHKHILLDAGARATSDPKLEVLSDDVSAGHGSAIRYVDDLQLFYLQSRGMDIDQARALLIEAFLA